MLGKDVSVRYGLESNETTKSSIYGIYNDRGTLQTGDGLSITLGGKLKAADGKTSTIISSGLYNMGGAIADVGNHLELESDFTSSGKVVGVISGIDVGRMPSARNSFTLGNHANVAVSFTGQGQQALPTVTYNGLDVRSLYSANSTVKAGDDNRFSALLGKDSTACQVTGASVRNSTVSLGNRIHLTAAAQEGSDAKYMRGLQVTENSKVTVGDHLGVTVETGGTADSAGGISASSNSDVKAGNGVTLSVQGGKISTGILASGNQSAITLGDQATIHVGGMTNGYGVYSQSGAKTIFHGAAEITATAKNGTAYAVVSKDKGSLVDLTGKGQKTIMGDFYSRDGGAIHLDLAAGNSLFTGMSKVNGGTTNLSMSNGSLWNMTDSSAVTNLDLNSGAKVDMTYNPDGYHTLTIDNFSGNGGEFHMKSDLESMTDGDKVHITNAAAGSSGQISVYDKSLATGSQMTGVHHLLMVTDASENATFSGKDLDTGGLWDIVPTVQRGGTFTDADGNVVGTPNEWYLVQTAKKVNKDTQPLVAGVDGTYSLYRMSIDTLRQRLGDLRYRNRSEDKYDIWARNRAGRYAGNGYDSQYNFFQAGLDTMPNEKSAYGFLVERGIASPDYRTGNGKNHTLAGALYGTWLGDSGSYTDVVAKVGRDDTTIHTFGQYPDAASYRAKEQSLSVEYGRTIPRGNKGWFVEPQAQFVFGHLGSNEYTTRRGTRVQEEGFNSAIGRLGFVLGKKQKEGRHPHDFYLKASVLHEFGGDRDYSLQRVNAAGDLERLDGKYSYGDTWYELGLGGNVQLNKNTLFYADVERSFAGDFNKKWQVNAGLNWSF
ncbi:autotransporter outer membrane beta-barrel domain-containing protein [Acidaminococcus timonensis]|uniref:autotransporter outer membrane beta-barrel domain-containing protein n=1 Tax=Acidaminococcus timonensis TaxID=1871002 RepID=UPI0025D93E04|nr:autotransporter outer membrane beta-barrel domain-containing protein [Acidaminococcus timonensis]